MKRCFAFLLSLLLLFPLCAGAERVVTSFYPVWLMAQNLTDGIDGLEVFNLADPGTGCLHDYTLRSSDMVSLSEADLLLINGAGMESFLPVVTGAYPELPIVDASAELPLLETNRDGEMNAHLWLDPQRAIGMAANLADGLCLHFPAYSERISRNLTAYRERLLSLEQTMREELEHAGPLPPAVIFHEAFPYFAEACGLPVLLTVDKEPDEDLPPSELAGILKAVLQSPDLPLIIKSNEPDRAADVLVSETGSPVCELDPITSGPDHPPLDYYESMMILNVRALVSALSDQ